MVQDECVELDPEFQYDELVISGENGHIHFRSYESMIDWMRNPDKQFYVERIDFIDFTVNALDIGIPWSYGSRMRDC